MASNTDPTRAIGNVQTRAFFASVLIGGALLISCRGPASTAVTPESAIAPEGAVVMKVAATPDVADASTQPTLRALYETTPDHWPAATWDANVPAEQRHELALVPKPVAPESNPFSKEKVALGQQLFWDPRLSGSKNVACVTCHHPDTGWADSKTVSQGHELMPLERNSPTIMGAALLPKLMWDGRAPDLESQALLPIANEDEMHGTFEDVEKILNDIPEYKESFKNVFGTDQIKMEHVAKAIATFERTVLPGRSRFDKFLDGSYGVLSDQQILGLHLFRTKARCINCHNGPLMSDGLLHNEGLTYFGRPFQDLGQYAITKKPEDVGKFRTPTLRNITRTSPYMHNGLFELDGVINMYNVGMPNERVKDPNDPLNPKKSPLLKTLALSKVEKEALIAFLETLEEPRNRIRSPALPGLRGVKPSTRPADAVDDGQ